MTKVEKNEAQNKRATSQTNPEKQWQAVETRCYKLFTKLLTDAQTHANVYAVTAEAGSGKSFTAKIYAGSHAACYHLVCNEYWNRKLFMVELLRSLGRDPSGYTVGEMMAEIVAALRKSDRPLIILDEADKLSDQLMFFFITLYNLLEGDCGIVMCATDHLQKRIEKGIRFSRRGYKEIFSRIGRRFVEIKANTDTDIRNICLANGITDELEITEIINDSEGDLRRVKRRVHSVKQREQ